jgi:hypothetical protein
MKLKQKKILLLAFALHFSVLTFAQKQTYIAVYNGYEKVGSNNMLHTYGASAELKFSKNFGLELGCNVKNYVFVVQNIKMNYAAIPLRLKYYTNIVDISVGADANYYMGWNYISDLVVPSTVYNDIFKISYTSIISKNIDLTSKFILEPQLSLNFNNPITSSSLNVGAGVKLKYRL